MADQAQFSVRGTAAHSRSIGITQRATLLALAWTGDQRVRFSDFQVNEIGVDGKVVHLSHVGLGDKQEQPVAETSVQASDDASRTAKDGPGSTDCAPPPQEEQTRDVSPEDLAILSGLAGDKFAEDLARLYQDSTGADGARPATVMSEPVDDKSKRGQIHGEVRRIFKSTIETSTDASGAILATRATKRGRKRGRRLREPREEKPTGEYLHFTLYKDNRDTLEAVNHMARVLRIKPQSVGYAGTKDRRASTAQRCSLRHVRSRALAGCTSKLWGIETGDYEYRDEPIHLGQLMGNEFVIVLKNCKIIGEPAGQTAAERLEALKAHVEAALQVMASRGWINYFGPQRFGTYDVGTHQIGKLIIAGKWEEAIMALLTYDQDIASRAANGEVPAEAVKRDQFARHHACMLFKTGQDLQKAASIIPARFAAESCIIRHLTKSGASIKDYSGALTHITRGLRSMYLHAYQSHVWNHAASRRWELHGDKVVRGDLVVVAAEAPPVVSGQDQDGDDIVNPVDDPDEASVRARPLTEEEASSGRYTIHDVVLPSPGFDVVYPDNEIGDFYRDFMAREENGGLDPHNMRRLRREFSLPGRYRKLMSRFLAPPSVEFRLYSDDLEQMHPTDVDLIRAAGASNGRRKRDADVADGGASKRVKVDADDGAKAEAEAEAIDQPGGQEQAADDDGAGDKEAVPVGGADRVAAVVKFQLGSSAYATVVLRELMGDLPDDGDVRAPAKMA